MSVNALGNQIMGPQRVKILFGEFVGMLQDYVFFKGGLVINLLLFPFV